MSFSLEWKAEGVIDGESEGGDCDEVMRARDEVNQKESEQDEVNVLTELQGHLSPKTLEQDPRAAGPSPPILPLPLPLSCPFFPPLLEVGNL